MHLLGLIGQGWGLAGVFLLVGSAVVRLSPVAVEAFSGPLAWYHWLVAVGWLAFMLVGEGYRGFQKGFSPRVVARARHLRQNPRTLPVLLAPAFCMGLFGAKRRRMITSWCVLLGIVCLVILVRQAPQPWRGIIDLGVVAGLAWGLAAMLVFALQAEFGQGFNADPELPLRNPAPGTE